MFFVLDVESVGLHGEGFAVGYVVVDEKGTVHEQGLGWCDPIQAWGLDPGREWVKEHVNLEGAPTHRGPFEVREWFWNQFQAWRDKGAHIFADCGYPVEAGFFRACQQDRLNRDFAGPFPLHEVQTILLATFVPGEELELAELVKRRESELPEHNPLKDARHSARILLTSLGYADHLTP